MEQALSLAHDSTYSPLFIQFPLSENENICHFCYHAIMRLMQTYETYADRFVRCEIKYLMFVFTSFKTSLIRKVKWV